MKTMSVKDFREEGYLQELNRKFLHPLGLALEVVLEDDGSESFGRVWDCRDDPDGIIFEKGVIDFEKAERISQEKGRKWYRRKVLVGNAIQPCHWVEKK